MENIWKCYILTLIHRGTKKHVKLIANKSRTICIREKKLFAETVKETEIATLLFIHEDRESKGAAIYLIL